MHAPWFGGIFLGGSRRVVSLRWYARSSYACMPSVVSCSSFRLPMHASPSRLFVTTKSRFFSVDASGTGGHTAECILPVVMATHVEAMITDSTRLFLAQEHAPERERPPLRLCATKQTGADQSLHVARRCTRIRHTRFIEKRAPENTMVKAQTPSRQAYISSTALTLRCTRVTKRRDG